MKYQIVYVSQSGNTERIVTGVKELFPTEETRLVDLTRNDASLDSDVYLVGFGMNQGTIPLQVMDLLEHLEGKTLLFLITCGIEPTAEYRKDILRRLHPFLPDQCDFRGIFLCPGCFAEEVISIARAALEEDPSAETPHGRRAKRILQEAELSNGHPNKEDVIHACNFVRHHLGME